MSFVKQSIYVAFILLFSILVAGCESGPPEFEVVKVHVADPSVTGNAEVRAQIKNVSSSTFGTIRLYFRQVKDGVRKSRTPCTSYDVRPGSTVECKYYLPDSRGKKVILGGAYISTKDDRFHKNINLEDRVVRGPAY